LNKRISLVYSHKGEIELENYDNYRLKYFLFIDSLYNLRFKIYDLTGIKISEFILTNDSLNVIYIIDNSYKNQITEVFKKYNQEKCLKQIVLDIFNSEIFTDSNNFKAKMHCYNRNIISAGNNIVYEISDLKYDKIFSISENGNSKKNYEISLTDKVKVKLKINN
jgi:hypothetical protein